MHSRATHNLQKSMRIATLAAFVLGLGVFVAPPASALGSQCMTTLNGKECAALLNNGVTYELEGFTTNNNVSDNFNGYDNFDYYPGGKLDCDNLTGGTTYYSAPPITIAHGDTQGEPDVTQRQVPGYYRIKFIRANGVKYPTGCFYFNGSSISAA